MNSGTIVFRLGARDAETERTETFFIMILSKRTDFVFTTAQPGTVLVGGNNPHRNVSIDKGYFEKNTENGKHRATVNGTDSKGTLFVVDIAEGTLTQVRNFVQAKYGNFISQ